MDVGAEPLVSYLLHQLQKWDKSTAKDKVRPDKVKSETTGKYMTFKCITDLLLEIEKGGTVDEISDRVEANPKLVCLREE